MPNVLVLIPARYGSTRFPGKPLALIAGKTMLQRVYENCSSSGFTTCVVTDSPQIEEHVTQFAGKVCRVDDDVPSGSIRIYLAYERFFKKLEGPPFTHLINVQGDEPLLKGEEIARLAAFHQGGPFDVVTIVKERGGRKENSNVDERDHLDPNVVKAIYSRRSGECHYFSRAPIPHYAQDTENKIWYQHVGVYSYLPAALEKTVRARPSFYEEAERLEQLRVLDESMRIGAIASISPLYSVDLPGDIARIEGVLSGTF